MKKRHGIYLCIFMLGLFLGLMSLKMPVSAEVPLEELEELINWDDIDDLPDTVTSTYSVQFSLVNWADDDFDLSRFTYATSEDWITMYGEYVDEDKDEILVTLEFSLLTHSYIEKAKTFDCDYALFYDDTCLAVKTFHIKTVHRMNTEQIQTLEYDTIRAVPCEGISEDFDLTPYVRYERLPSGWSVDEYGNVTLSSITNNFERNTFICYYEDARGIEDYRDFDVTVYKVEISPSSTGFSPLLVNESISLKNYKLAQRQGPYPDLPESLARLNAKLKLSVRNTTYASINSSKLLTGKAVGNTYLDFKIDGKRIASYALKVEDISEYFTTKVDGTIGAYTRVTGLYSASPHFEVTNVTMNANTYAKLEDGKVHFLKVGTCPCKLWFYYKMRGTGKTGKLSAEITIKKGVVNLPSSATVYLNKTKTIEGSLAQAVGFSKVTSSDKTIATTTIAEDRYSFKIKGLKVGTVTLNITLSNGENRLMTVNVKKGSVSMPETATVYTKNSIKVSPTFTGVVTVSSVSFTDATVASATISSDKKYITFKGLKSGTVTATVKFSNNMSRKLTLTVKKSGVKTVSSSYTMDSGTSKTITPTITGPGTIKTVTCSTSGAVQLSIVNSGKGIKMTALKQGSHTITVTLTDGNSCTFTVKVIANEADIDMKTAVSVYAKHSVTVTPFFKKDGLSVSKVTSSDTSIATATVSSDGQKFTVKGVSAGTAMMTVTFSSGIRKKLDVTVKKSGVTTSLSTYKVIKDKTYKITPTITGGSTIKNVSWGNSSIVTASIASDRKSITLNGKGIGSTTVTIYLYDGNKCTFTAKCVNPPKMSQVEAAFVSETYYPSSNKLSVKVKVTNNSIFRISKVSVKVVALLEDGTQVEFGCTDKPLEIAPGTSAYLTLSDSFYCEASTEYVKLKNFSYKTN